MPQPILETERLVLRPFVLEDAPDVQRLAGAREIADTTSNIPHPYEDGMAEQWIGTHPAAFASGAAAVYAVTIRATGELCGACGLILNLANAHAELGYWVGVPYWGRGYGTEAARAVTWLGFERLGLRRIFAQRFSRNPASGRILEKVGMRHEGRLRQHVREWDGFEDVELYGILDEEWAAIRPAVMDPSA